VERAGRVLAARFELNVCAFQKRVRWSAGACTFPKWPLPKGASVLVPKGVHLVLDQSVETALESVVVEGVLEVDLDAKDINLRVRGSIFFFFFFFCGV
jgi:hypothetical protein